MWGNDHTIKCVHCEKEIEGCCYPAYEGTVKIGYRHISCYPSDVQQPKDYSEILYPGDPD